jgi:hypothetical protein
MWIMTKKDRIVGKSKVAVVKDQAAKIVDHPLAGHQVSIVDQQAGTGSVIHQVADEMTESVVDHQ